MKLAGLPYLIIPKFVKIKETHAFYNHSVCHTC
jgi:hypothetical protein